MPLVISTEHEAALVASDLADCLRRFLTASADESVMRQAIRALAAWDELGLAPPGSRE